MQGVILYDVKKQIGIDELNDDFDKDLIVCINSSLFILEQLGVGKRGVFITLNGNQTWADFLMSDQLNLRAVKEWVSLKVKMMFDPPTSSILKQTYDETLRELEWRIYITENYVGEIGGTKKSIHPFDSITYYDPYLYFVEFSEFDYDYANKYMSSNSFKPNIGGCTSIRNGNWYGRNFDYTYGEQAEFAVRTKIEGKHSTIGVTGKIEGLTRGLVESSMESDLYKLIPFMIVDGINDAGLVCNVNLVPNDLGDTIGTTPNLEEKYRLNSLMIPRFVLDNFSKAKAAVNYLKDYVSIYVPSKLRDMGYEEHFMIADSESTYVVEFVNNTVHIIDVSEKPYVTNFFVNGVTFNSDGKVYTPADVSEDHLPTVENGITQNGSGLERYNFIVDEYTNCGTYDGMRRLMNKLRFTKAYKESTNPYWYSEFVGNGLTVDSPAADFYEIIASAQEAFFNRSRSSEKTWQTNHSCVYNIEHKILYLYGQENSDSIYEIKF